MSRLLAYYILFICGFINFYLTFDTIIDRNHYIGIDFDRLDLTSIQHIYYLITKITYYEKIESFALNVPYCRNCICIIM